MAHLLSRPTICSTYERSEIGFERGQSARTVRPSDSGKTEHDICSQNPNTIVPKPLLAMNLLATATVSAMVSLTVWNARIGCEDFLTYHPATLSYDLPDGIVLSLARFPDSVVFNIDASFRITDQQKFVGIGTTKGMAVSWDGSSGEDLKLTIVRLSAYEAWIPRSCS